MANTIYRSRTAVTLARRAEAYERICDLLRHLDHWNLNLLRLELVAGNFVEIELNNPIPNPSVQLEHLGVEAV